MASEKVSESSDSAAGVANRIEDLLTQLEGHGLKRNGHDDLLARAADAETYYGDNDLAVDVLRNKYQIGRAHV